MNIFCVVKILMLIVLNNVIRDMFFDISGYS